MSPREYVPQQGHSEMPVSESFHDLVASLAAKLDETRQYDTYERHARAESKHDLAALFARLAARDRRSIEELMQSLRAHEPEERVHSIFVEDEQPFSDMPVDEGVEL